MTMNPDDLSELEVLDENTIVQALRTRYNREKYYVSSYLISIYTFLRLIKVIEY